MKKILFIIALIILTSCTPLESTFKSNIEPIPFDDIRRRAENVENITEAEMPDSINLDVPFFSQAPDADWDMPWQEACEEASVVLAYYYITNQPLTKGQFKKEILSLVDWQNEHFGNYEHTNIEQTVKMLTLLQVKNSKLETRNSKFEVQVSNNPLVEDLKKELAQGHIIIAPFAGRQLKNPFYSNEGPYYHMMVLKGYDQKHFITNDVGTKRGHNFIYPYDRIMSAMHEWHDEDINLGGKKVIVLAVSDRR